MVVIPLDSSDGPASGGLDNVTLHEGLKALLQEKGHAMWLLRKEKIIFQPHLPVHQMRCTLALFSVC